MSDPGRKSLSTQTAEKVTPDSQKTTGEKVKETLTGTVDRVKAAITPDSRKSVTQQTADRTRGEP
jgi:hypothetical protein